MSENEAVQQLYYWLNPATLKDKAYRVHRNHTIENNESSSPQWAYSTIPPEACPLSWRFVFSPHLLSAEESAEIEMAKTTKEKTEEQADLINEINRNKKHRRGNQYIGDSEPVAQGITAFFIKRTPGKDDDYGSVLSLLKRDESFDIYDWYKAYWKEQKAFAEHLNTQKTTSQGRLTNEAFLARFIEDHLIQEQDLFKRSEKFFSDDFYYETNDIKHVIGDYAEGYLEWVAGKNKDIIQGYQTGKTREQLLSFFDSLTKKDFFQKENPINRNDFADVFSGQIMRSRVTYKASKKRLASIIKRLTGKDAAPHEVNQRFVFQDVKKFSRGDRPNAEHSGLKSCYEEVFKKRE